MAQFKFGIHGLRLCSSIHSMPSMLHSNIRCINEIAYSSNIRIIYTYNNYLVRGVAPCKSVVTELFDQLIIVRYRLNILPAGW